MTKTYSDFARYNSETGEHEAINGGIKYSCDRSSSTHNNTLGLGGTSITDSQSQQTGNTFSLDKGNSF